MFRTLLTAVAFLFVALPSLSQTQVALVAGGCFWCVESDFRRVPGVVGVQVGFAGGRVDNPTYRQVSAGGTGHLEVTRISFDPAQITYSQVLHLFMRSIDPLDAGGQFCDRGESYRTALFVTPEQRSAAQAALDQATSDLGQPVVTPLRDAARFWPAEAYHQNYAQSGEIILTRWGPLTKRTAYQRYRTACGRDARLREIWGASAAFAR